MNILITCGGGFQGQTLITDLKFLPNVVIHVADINEMHSNQLIADFSVTSPEVKKTAEYAQFLRAYSLKNSIELIIPATAFDLELLSELKNEFKSIGSSVLVPDLLVLRQLNSKISAYAILKKNKIPVQDQKSYENPNAYPLIAKPISGWGGLNIFRFQNIAEMKNRFYGNPELYSWTSLITNFLEYSIDFAIGPNGEKGDCIYRLRERTSSGFATQALIEEQPPQIIKEIGEKLSTIFSSPAYSGIYNIQVIQNENNAFVSDINCRIGTSAIGSIFRNESLLNHLFNNKKQNKFYNSARYFRSLYTRVLPDIQVEGINHLVFDLDDTLISNRNWILNRIDILHSASDKLQNSISKHKFLEWVEWQLTEGKAPSLMDLVFNEFKPYDNKEQLIEIYRKCYPDKLLTYDDVLPTLEQLNHRGYKLSLLSDNPKKTQSIKWSLFPGSKWMHHVLFTAELNSEKPAGITFETICDKASAKPSTSVMIGNHPYRDLQGSLQANFKYAFFIRRNDDLLANGSGLLTKSCPSIINLNSLTDLLYYFK